MIGLGAALAVLFALAWNDALPAKDALRDLLVDDASRAEQERRVHRAERLSRFAREAEVDADVLLIGSSTIERAGEDLLARTGLVRVNRGIGDEPLELLSERFATTVARTTPELVVLYAGSVDARRPTRSEGPGEPPSRWREVDDLAAEIGAMVDDALGVAPEVRILLLEVLPETEPRPDVTERVRALNAALRGLAATRERVGLLETWRAPLVDARSGVLREAIAADTIHLGPSGYDALERWLRGHPWVSEVVTEARVRAAGAAPSGAPARGQ